MTHGLIPATGSRYNIYHRLKNREGDRPYSGSRETAVDKLVHKPDGSIEPVVMTD